MKMIAMAALAALGLAFMIPATAHANDQQNLVDESRITLDHLRTDKEFGNAKELLRKARAVLIVPNLVKAGFFLGGEGGDGVMLARSGRGTWTDPAFYTMASASFGQFKFGAQAGIAVVTLGAGAQAASSTALESADIIVWSSASGAYAGLTLEGSLVKPRDSYNEAYYGRPIAVREILNMNAGRNPGAETLRAALK
jgi:lipid-binding SYLF domain-containing protein